MDSLGGKLLSRASLPLNQNRHRSGRVFLEIFNHFAHLRAVADHPLETEFLIQLPFQFAVGPRQLEAFGSAIDHGSQFRHVDRFGQVVGCPLLDGLYRTLDIPVSGNEDDFGIGQLLFGFAQKLQAVQVLHFEVGQNDIEIFLLDELGPFEAAGGDNALVADARQALGHGFGMKFLIVYDEDSQAGSNGCLKGGLHPEKFLQSFEKLLPETGKNRV
ncbi:MAG: hypothetical protein KatS3mg105_0489 [Gemmatales bacterium]|nr:MAG: hypothetical protein KatS3mg105_0489 [Gemmatales bacterium]